MPVYFGDERGAGRQTVGRVAMATRFEDTRAAVLEPNVHFPFEDENPLWPRRAVKLAAIADRTVRNW